MSRAGLLLSLFASQTFTAQVIDNGLSDYQGLDAVRTPWTKEYFTKLKHTNSSTQLENLETKFVPRWNVTLLKNVDSNVQYGYNNIQYGNHNTQYGYNNIQYGTHNIQYGHDNRQHGEHNVQYGMYNTQYGRHNIQHGQYHYQDGDHKVQFAELNIQYGANDIQNGGSDNGEQTPNENGRKSRRGSVTRGSATGGSVIGESVTGGSVTGRSFTRRSVIGGSVIGGSTIGGSTIGGSVTGGGGGTVIGGTTIGGSTIGGSVTGGGGGTVIGGTTIGGSTIGGSVTGGGGGTVIGGTTIGGSTIGGSVTGGGGSVTGRSYTGWSGRRSRRQRGRRSRRSVTEDIYFSKGLNDSSNDAVYLKVEKNVRTTAEDHLQDVRLITLSSANPLQYNPGDIFTFRPRNCQDDVDDLFRIFNEHGLDIKPMYKLLVEEMDEGMPVPPFLQTPLTLHQIADQYWDLQAYPTQNVFSLLAHISEDKLEKDKCIELSSPDDREGWLNYSWRTKRTILEVLRDFPQTTSKLTIAILFELFSTIKPRSFAIASSNLQSPNSLDLMVDDVVEIETELQMPRKGLGSNWLKGLTEDDGVYGWIKKGSFVFPEDVSTPLILITPGTALAPTMRSIIQQRYHLNTLSNDTVHLIYGCRYRNKHFYFKEELDKMVQEGKLNLYYDFSRDQEDEIYVQHNISKHKSTLWDLIHNKNAHIYISENAKNMPVNEKKAFIRFIQNVFKYGGMNIDEANEFMERMVNEGRLQIEAW